MTLDELWKDHLLSLDHLRHGIHLRAFGQRDPLNEYKQEAFSMFESMLNQLRESVTVLLARIQFRADSMEHLDEMESNQEMHETRNDPAATGEAQQQHTVTAKVVSGPIHTHIKPEDRDANDPESWGKIGRNEDCPCGSGKKYKHCHG